MIYGHADRLIRTSLLVALLSAGVPAAHGQDSDPFQFFEEEARVVTASRLPGLAHLAPATIHVLSHEEVETSGVHTLWDALRSVPGVHVVNTRTFQGEISIRGPNRPLNNRTLILLDGKTVLNGFFDFVTWEAIPITLREIDRIEVVEGPASALYGANAINGVINIITRDPEQLQGGEVSYTGGEFNTHLASALYGQKVGRLGYKFGLGWRSTNSFSEPDRGASRVIKFHTALDYILSSATSVKISGGFSDLNTQLSTGPGGTAFNDGPSGFLRLDADHGASHLRFFWNRGRTVFRNFQTFDEPNLDYDTYDVNLERTVRLPLHNRLVVGSSYRLNTTRSTAFEPGLRKQHLWALFFENVWKPAHRWKVVASGRLDRHPFTDLVFSPRVSLMFNPLTNHTLRLSAGTAFRNPTLTENYLSLTQTLANSGEVIPNPPFTTIRSEFRGNRGLAPEHIRTVEFAHGYRGARLRTTATVYYYSLDDVIDGTTSIVSMTPPTLQILTSFINSDGGEAWGGEIAFEAALSRSLHAFLNYAYQEFEGEAGALTARHGPRHKINAGGGFTWENLKISLAGHWVDKTLWSWGLSVGTAAPEAGTVASHLLLNARIGYAFKGALDGLELAVSAFNLTDHEHFQVLPARSSLETGQNGEIVRRRLTGTISYRF